MRRSHRILLWVYIAFNLLITVVLIASPEGVDATYRGGPMTPTRQFQWFSIASFHGVLIAMTLVSLRLERARERRSLHAINAGFYLWDAATQLAYWGRAVGVEPGALYVNAGVSAAIGAALLWVWWTDR